MEVRNIRWVGIPTRDDVAMRNFFIDVMGLVAAGIEIAGPAGEDSGWRWIHFRAPDGNLYELAGRRHRPTA